MAHKLTYLLTLVVLLEISLSGAEVSSCSKRDKAAILLDAANDFISRAKEFSPTCLFDNSLERDKSSEFLDTAKTLVSSAKNAYSTNPKYKLVCYFSSWAYYRKGEGKYYLSSFQPHLCTHAIYAMAKLENNTIESRLPDVDLPENLDGYRTFNNLKKVNPKLKTLISIGGWIMGSANFSLMAADKTNRTTFIESVLVFLNKYGFDGLSLDWEFPGVNGGRPEDKGNFVILLQELKAALKPQGFLLTSTVSPIEHFIDAAYDIPAISKELDQIHLLAFNLHGYWQPVTGHNAPLYAASEASDEDKELTVDFAVNYWLNNGAPKEKLILGMPFFGRSFTLANPDENGVLAASTGGGLPGRLNGDGDGMLGFNEICENLLKSRWASVWDPDAQTPYAYKGNQWVGYDDQKSLNDKVDYLIQKGLGGGAVWSFDYDDAKGTCYGKKYYLLRTVASKLLA